MCSRWLLVHVTAGVTGSHIGISLVAAKKKQETVASIQCDSAPLFVDVDIGILPPFAVSLI